MSDVCVVELGRNGDIINLLPVLKHLSIQFENPPTLMVSREFENLLDGISYVKPYVLDLPFTHLDEALKLAREKFSVVVPAQVCGRGNKFDYKTSNFNLESWNMAGFQHEFHNPSWKPEFDKRDWEMESAISRKVFRTNLPKVVVNLTHALSAPLPCGDVVLDQLQFRWKDKFEVVDIGKLRLQHIYDMLGIMERAALIVSVDTATLHLAAGCDAPVICAVRDGWVGTLPRYNCQGRLLYSDLQSQPSLMNAKIDEFLEQL